MGQDVGKVMREEGSIHNLILLGSEKEGILFRRAALGRTILILPPLGRTNIIWS